MGETCEVCGEYISMLEIESGQAAEMFNPKNPEEGGVCHPNCGLSKGWEVA